MPIAQVFATKGEPAFRALEARMVEHVANRTGSVVATGGGTIVDPRNFDALKRDGLIITLTADPQTIMARIGPGEDRPMLWGGDKLERIHTLLEQRAPVYVRLGQVHYRSCRLFLDQRNGAAAAQKRVHELARDCFAHERRVCFLPQRLDEFRALPRIAFLALGEPP